MSQGQDPSAAAPSASDKWPRVHRASVSLLAHAGLLALAWFMAFGLAYNFKNFDFWFVPFFATLALPIVALKLLIFAALGVHHGWWRYVSLRDLRHIAMAAWIGFFVCFVMVWALQILGRLGYLGPAGYIWDEFPASAVLISDFGWTIGLVGGARILVRLYHEEIRGAEGSVARRVLILGAGNSGENLVRELLRMPALEYQIVGFLDDDPAKRHARIHTIEVLGQIAEVTEVCDEYDVDEILIAMPSADSDQMRRVVELCQGTNVKFKTLPAMTDLIQGRGQFGQMRDVSIDDLLGRDPVKLDEDDIAAFIKDRTVMVTGAGGSIGSEMCRQVARFRPKRLLLVEQAEQHLFDIHRELRVANPELDVVPFICDISDARRVDRIFGREHPSAVFHAAAHKHVPMMEFNPGEAIKNNVLGTRTIADAAVRYNCEKFVMISTDKAVNPTSIMGCSKRVAELYVQALAPTVDTQFVTVRFGNVLGSSGSVIPIFREQISRGGPVTVTHPDMVRYFMTIPEAAQLVLQSASMSAGDEIFVLDMGAPVKIVDLARDLITLSGYRVGEDIEIKFVGVRPGEKLFEELAIDGEDVARTTHPKIGIWNVRRVELAELLPQIDDIIARSDDMNRDDVRDALKHIVPEFMLEAPPALDAPVKTRQLAGAQSNGAASVEADERTAEPAADTGTDTGTERGADSRSTSVPLRPASEG